MAADRAQHVAEVVRPALAAGRHVVCDRYIGSTLAYQGHGRGLPVVDLRRISAWAAADLWPDLIVLLDVPREVSVRRAAAAPDRLEAAGEQFHDRVARGYRALASADASRWVTIDGSAPPDEVEAAVWTAVTTRLPDLVEAPSDGGGGYARPAR
jgi:dTMP kinase